MEFKIGQKTNNVWSGDLVRECEFIAYLDRGAGMLFYDIDSRCFRYVFWQYMNGKFILNGWKCAKTVSELIKV